VSWDEKVRPDLWKGRGGQKKKKKLLPYGGKEAKPWVESVEQTASNKSQAKLLKTGGEKRPGGLKTTKKKEKRRAGAN